MEIFDYFISSFSTIYENDEKKLKISIRLFVLFVLDFKTSRCYYSEFVYTLLFKVFIITFLMPVDFLILVFGLLRKDGRGSVKISNCICKYICANFVL